MLGSVHEYEIVIKEHHLDGFGHVNNAMYLQLFEEARWELITQNGYGLGKIMECRLGPVILEAHLEFKHELRNRKRVHIRSWLESYEGKIGHMVQHMVGDDGGVYCEARFVFALFDLDGRRLVDPTPEWRRAVGLPPEG
jgi:thioesterase III